MNSKDLLEYIVKTLREHSDEVEIVGLKFVVVPKTMFDVIDNAILVSTKPNQSQSTKQERTDYEQPKPR